jgi:LacI family transcriptional regulator
MKNENRGRKRTTLRDVAEAAGVSVMTVSNVVCGKHRLVNRETRKKVEVMIAKLNYRPNVSARRLRIAEERAVGVLIADSDPAFLIDPFIGRLVSGLSNSLSNIDFTLDIQGVVPERFEHATILRKAGNDALCAILSGPTELRRKQLDCLQRTGLPVVVFQDVLKSTLGDIATVAQDDLSAGKLVAEHLLTQALRSVVFLRPMLDWPAVAQREKGVRSVFAAASQKLEVTTLFATSESFDHVKLAVKDYLATRLPDAIVAATDSMAAAVLDACTSQGLNVPRDIIVTGFNGFDVWRYTRPTLTTVISPAYEMGRYAGELLVQRLREGTFAKRNTIFPVSLQVGGSSSRESKIAIRA